MRKTTLVSLACSLSLLVVAGSVPARTIASDADSLSINSLLNDPEAAIQTLNERIDSLLEAHRIGAALVQEFDQELAKAQPGTGSAAIFSTGVYGKLIGLNATVHEMQDQVSNALQDLGKFRATSVPRPFSFQSLRLTAATKVFTGVNRHIQSLMNSDAPDTAAAAKLALANWVGDLNQNFKGILDSATDQVEDQVEEMRESLSASLVATQIATMPLHDIAKNSVLKAQLIEQGKAILNQGSPLLTRATEIGTELQAQLIEAMDGEINNRSPQADLKIYPSSGSAGNVTGNTFPAKTWALTFDDGPHASRTAAVIKNLNDHGMKATFFCLAELLLAHKEAAKLYQKNGMALANHSYTHANLPKLGSARLRKEIISSTDVDEATWGVRPKFFRCPYGACGKSGGTIRQMIADQGMVHVFWNVDTLDWQDRDPDSVFRRAVREMELNKQHGVILFHDIHSQSVTASNMVMDYVQGHNLRAVTLPQIVAEINGQ